jgi:hypothetical protein
MRLTRIPHLGEGRTARLRRREPGGSAPMIAPRHGVARRAALITAVVVLMLVSAVGPAGAETTTVLAVVGSIKDAMTNVQIWLTGLLIVLATLMLTWGAVRYLAAGGEPGEVEKAKQSLKNAGKGYLLAVLAPVIVEILRQFVGG